MGINSVIKTTPPIKALFNMGSLMDIPNCSGSYRFGKHGEALLNGGLSNFEGIGGRANTHKSSFMHFRSLRLIDRYPTTTGSNLDTEFSQTTGRFNLLRTTHPRLEAEKFDFEDEDQQVLTITDARKYRGDDYWEEVKDYTKIKMNSKDAIMTLPFVSGKGQNFKGLVADMMAIDSLSRMGTKSLDKIIDNNDVGSNSMQTFGARDSGVKAQMLIQISDYALRTGLVCQLTAHVDDEVNLEMFPTSTKKLSFLKNGLKFKYVSNQFAFLPNNLWYVFSASPYNNATTKYTEYPRDKSDTNSTDLMRMFIQNLRGKFGSSGSPTELMVSQRNGILPTLSEYHYCRKMKNKPTEPGFGLVGNNSTAVLALKPDVKFTRNTIRTKYMEHPELVRGFEITSEIGQMKELWHHLPANYKLITMEEIYEKLVELGYDVDFLLRETRGFWTHVESEDMFGPFLSSWDVLRIVFDEYYPYWYDKAIKDHGLKPIKNRDVAIKKLKETCPWVTWCK